MKSPFFSPLKEYIEENLNYEAACQNGNISCLLQLVVSLYRLILNPLFIGKFPYV
jgi:hypothetical protein